MDASEARSLFEQQMESIEAVLDYIVARNGLAGDAADSFRSYARFKLVDDDYAVVRKFSGRSSLKTYLTTVLANAYRDYRISKWGRWRPSAGARRLGRAAVLLDTYLNRDGQPLEEAIARVCSRGDVDETEAQLRAWAAKIPRRARRTLVPIDSVGTPVDPVSADNELTRGGLDESRRRALEALEAGISALPERTQVMLRLRFWEGLTVANIARRLGVEQKPLYRQFESCLEQLRGSLESAGVGAHDILDLIE